MEGTLHFLDSFPARGSDGRSYKVRTYEHMVRDPSLPLDLGDHWESTGLMEYRLDGGERVACSEAGELRIASTGVVLDPLGRH